MPQKASAFSRFRNHLTRIEDQPLGKAALAIILLLDLFILTSIFDGLAVHTGQLTSPEEHIPGPCREIVLEGGWNPSSRIEKLSGTVDGARPMNSYQPAARKGRENATCAPYLDLLEQIKKDPELAQVFTNRRALEREAKTLQLEINNRKGAYDTALLERSAAPGKEPLALGAIQQDIQTKSAALDNLRGRINALEQTINTNQTVSLLWQKMEQLQPAQQERLKADLRRVNFWFPVKRLGMELLFLLPIFAVLYLWNAASIIKNRGTQTLVSSHLLVVSIIPILGKISEAVYDILPKKFFTKLIEFLESLKLVAIWHYLVMALAVAAALFFIYLFQKKLFSREKLMERRIGKGQCQQCGKPLPRGATACVFCGFNQFKACPACGKPTQVGGTHCQHCGAAQ